MAAGFFDGVHRGHLKVLSATIASAQKRNGEAWALSFDRHPLEILQPGSEPELITSKPHKKALLEKIGMDGCVFMRFTRRLAEMEPGNFARALKDSAPSLSGVFIGQNWRFGRGGKGSPSDLSRFGRKLGFDVSIIRPATVDGKPVSSTRIRKLVAGGRLQKASRLLGRPVGVLGKVVKGRGIGRRLGFPTANMDPYDELLPPTGVYAVSASMKNRLFDGVLNLGIRPTYIGETAVPLPELHLLDVETELYGKTIEVFFIEKIRSERRFKSEEELKRSIARDAEKAKTILRENKLKKNS